MNSLVILHKVYNSQLDIFNQPVFCFDWILVNFRCETDAFSINYPMNKKLYDKHFSCVLNFEMLLTRHIVTLIFILITRNAQMTSCIGLKRSFAMLAKKGKVSKDNYN